MRPKGAAKASSKAASASITAALIVRDEARFLPGCLASISELVDEIVVVDTGSEDESREIARAAGARVLEYPWHDDFAAARNRALERAEGGWILYIDADERVRPADRGALLDDLSRDEVVCYTVRFHPRPGYTAYPEYRVFRNDPRIRFTGAIHESHLPDVRRVVAADGSIVGHCGLIIDHLGYEDAQERKHARNLPLLLRRVRETPERTYLWWHLGHIYRALGQAADAEAAWLRAIEPARTGAARTREESLCYGELARLLYERGGDPMPLVREGLGYFPENLLLRWIEAKLLAGAGAGAGAYDAAAAIFEALGLIDPETWLDVLSFDVRIMGADALADRARLALRAGKEAEAAEWFARAGRMRAAHGAGREAAPAPAASDSVP